MLVADWPAAARPSAADLAALGALGERSSAGLSVALSYAHLREQAGVDERRHLARAMHDGIAQEIAAVGFHLDMIRYAAEHAGDATAPELASLRAIAMLAASAPDCSCRRSHISEPTSMDGPPLRG